MMLIINVLIIISAHAVFSETISTLEDECCPPAEEPNGQCCVYCKAKIWYSYCSPDFCVKAYKVCTDGDCECIFNKTMPPTPEPELMPPTTGPALVLVTEFVHATTARADCKAKGMELVTIESKEKQDTVDSLIIEKDINCFVFWIGLYREGLGQPFHWSDGTGATDRDYINELWGLNQPRWNDHKNIDTSYYIRTYGVGDDGLAISMMCYICQSII